MTPIFQYLHNGTLPNDPVRAKRMAREASYYTIIEGHLCIRGLSHLLLKCISSTQISFILKEIHEWSCCHHLEGKVLILKVLRA